jgi:lipid-binding SYLF domain-containing protein
MNKHSRFLGAVAGLILAAGVAQAAPPGKYAATIALFKNAGESGKFFADSYAYAVFPTVGEGGFIAGAAIGKGRVYVHHHLSDHLIGDTTMKQLSLGFQAGGKVYSQIIFFKDKSALERFESGSFEFAAGASAIAITAGANASVGTDGATSGASGTDMNATTAGVWSDGMAVFTIAKGGLMYAATIAGQRFSYKERGTG